MKTAHARIEHVFGTRSHVIASLWYRGAIVGKPKGDSGQSFAPAMLAHMAMQQGFTHIRVNDDKPVLCRNLAVLDCRHSITREHTGSAYPEYVFRWLGEYVSAHSSYTLAYIAACHWEEKRQATL